MAIKKPTELSNWLARFNWDLLGQKLYAGDAIEAAIDWAIDWLNFAVESAGKAMSKARDAWDRAVELGQTLMSTIYRETQDLWERIYTWWSDLGEWWAAKRQDIWDWIDAAVQDAKELISGAEATINKVTAWWDDFKTKIPSIDEIVTWFRTWRDKVIATMVTWGALTGKEIEELLNSKVKDIEPFWKGWQDIRDKVMELFTDPQKWLLDQIEKMLARFL